VFWQVVGLGKTASAWRIHLPDRVLRLLANSTSQVVQAALHHSRTIDVQRWCQEQLGRTIFGKRKLAFAESATKDG
jgi:hypothetical protein